MIKKLIGIIVAVAVIVIVVVAAVRRHNFQSMVMRDEIMNQTLPTPEERQPGAIVIPEAGAVVPDTAAVETVDSLPE